MPSTGVQNGKDVLLLVDGTAVGCGISHDENLETEMIETTCKDSAGYKTFIPGDKSATFSAEFLFKQDATYGYVDLVTAWNADTALTVRSSSSVSGDNYLEATAYIQSLSRTMPNSETISATVTFQVTGTVTYGTEV